MSHFGKVLKLLNKTESGFAITWINLDKASQIEEIKRESTAKIIAIFKHSTSCSISAMAKNRMKKMEVPENNSLEFYYLDILSNRSISNLVAEEFKVRHESPQLLIIRNAEVVESVSHGRVSRDVLEKYL